MENEYSETNMKQALCIGLFVGILVTIGFWILIADKVEMFKVNDGYLTYKDKTYKVVLYDTLDAPKKEDERKE